MKLVKKILTYSVVFALGFAVVLGFNQIKIKNKPQKKEPIKTLLMFQGQGSQFLGMGKDLSEKYSSSKAVFDEVDKALGNDFTNKIIFGDDINELTKGYNNQPALMSYAVATYKALQEKYGEKLNELNIQGVAGNSLGDYSSLCVSSGLDVGEMAKLLRARGKYMSECAQNQKDGVQGMSAIVGSNYETIKAEIEKLKNKTKVLVISNSNSFSQIVVSGYKQDIEKLVENLKKENEKIKIYELKVEGAFHSPLMEQARAKFEPELEKLNIKELKYPMLQSASKTFETDWNVVKQNLKYQITEPVYWREMIQTALNEGFNTFIEFGNKKVLSKFVESIAKQEGKQVKTVLVGKVEDVESFFENLNKEENKEINNK